MSRLANTDSTHNFLTFMRNFTKAITTKLEDLSTLRDLSDKLEKEILKLDDPYDVGIAYFLHLSLVNILYNSIEEDSLKGKAFTQLMSIFKEKIIRITDLKGKGKNAESFLPLADIANQFLKIITQNNYIDQKEVAFEYKGQRLSIKMSPRGERHSVATRFYPFFFNLDELLLTPKSVKVVGPAFLKEIQMAVQSEHVNKLCFIEKLYGPIGAVTFLPYLVEKTELPSIIYRPAHWNPKSKITGKVRRTDRICVVYDLAVTGDSLLDCAQFLRKNYPKVKVASAVILYDYKRGAEEKLLEHDIKLRSIISLTQKELRKIFLKRYEEEWKKLHRRILNREVSYDGILKEERKLYHKFATYELFARKR